jgi:hypothetical protein
MARTAFTVELTKGRDHNTVVKSVPLQVPSLMRAIKDANRLVLRPEGPEAGADGYVIRDEHGIRWMISASALTIRPSRTSSI